MKTMMIAVLVVVMAAACAAQYNDGMTPLMAQMQQQQQMMQQQQQMMQQQPQQQFMPQPAFPFNPPPLPTDLVRQQQGAAMPRFRQMVGEQAQQQVQQQVQQQAAVPVPVVKHAVRPKALSASAAKKAEAAIDAAVSTPPPQPADASDAAGKARFKSVLPEAHKVVQDALVETKSSTETPAAKTEPLSSSSDGSAAKTKPIVQDKADEHKIVMMDATTVGDDARFASAKSKSKSKSGEVTPITKEDDDGTAESEGSDEDSSESSTGTRSVVTGKAAKTNEVQEEGDGEYHKCDIRTDKHCIIKFGRDINWKVRTVPRGSLKDVEVQKGGGDGGDDKTAEQKDEDEEEDDPDKLVISQNPAIAKKQKEYYAKKAEIKKEQEWVHRVAQIVRNYQNKIFNVRSHISNGKAQLSRLRNEINNMIKQTKRDKLMKELKAATDAMKELQEHSETLSSKAKEMSRSKNSLRATVAKIKLALGAAANESFDTEERFRELILRRPPSQNEVARFRELMGKNEEVKGAMGSLLETLAQNHPDVVAAAHEHEPVVHHQPAPVAHHHAPVVARHPDLDLIEADVDPSITHEELERQFHSVVSEADANSDLE